MMAFGKNPAVVIEPFGQWKVPLRVECDVLCGRQTFRTLLKSFGAEKLTTSR